jgi:predicted GIY-YIG superfamily endonuclease
LRIKTGKSNHVHTSANHDDGVSNVEDNNQNRKKGSIYVLHLEDNNFYVGKTIRNVNTRIKEHLDNGYMTSRWTKQYKPLRRLAPLTSIPDDLESWERAETLERMWIYGIQRVRGWKYTQLNLTTSDQSQVIMQLCERKDLCRCCGNFGHGISHCSSRKYSKARWMTDIKKSGYLNPEYRGKIFEREFVNMLTRANTNSSTGSKRDVPGYRDTNQFNISGIHSMESHRKNKRLLLLNNITVDNYSDTILQHQEQQQLGLEDPNNPYQMSSGGGKSIGESYLSSISRGPMSSSSSAAAAARGVRWNTPLPLQLSHRGIALLLQIAYAITTAW